MGLKKDNISLFKTVGVLGIFAYGVSRVFCWLIEKNFGRTDLYGHVGVVGLIFLVIGVMSLAIMLSAMFSYSIFVFLEKIYKLCTPVKR